MSSLCLDRSDRGGWYPSSTVNSPSSTPRWIWSCDGHVIDRGVMWRSHDHSRWWRGRLCRCRFGREWTLGSTLSLGVAAEFTRYANTAVTSCNVLTPENLYTESALKISCNFRPPYSPQSLLRQWLSPALVGISFHKIIKPWQPLQVGEAGKIKLMIFNALWKMSLNVRLKPAQARDILHNQNWHSSY